MTGWGYTRTPSPAQQRQNKVRRLVNLSIHEVSSVDRGAAHGAKVLLRKRDEGKNEMHIDKHAPRGGLGVDESEKMARRDLKTADHVLRAFNLAKLNREHSEGKVSNVLYSQLLRHMAEAQYPGDKNAFAKFMKDNTLEMAEKVRADNAQQQQQTALGNGYGAPLGVGSNWNGAVGRGDGIAPRVQGNTYSGSAVDSQFSASPFTNAGSAVDASKSHASLVNLENIRKLQSIDPSLTFDAAATMLSRGGK
jgi:hypothetical protein